MTATQLLEYVPVANLLLTAGGLAVVVNIFRAFEATKSAQVSALEERLKLAEATGVEAFSSKLEAVRSYYESYYELPIVQKWYEQSLTSINSLREVAQKMNDQVEISLLQNELRVRRELLDRYLSSSSKQGGTPTRSVEIEGAWVVLGRHPADKDYYRGSLHIERNGESITGQWSFPYGHIRTESADGIRLGDHVAFALSDGIALYQIVDNSMLLGRWIRGDLLESGTEECRRREDA